MKKKIFTLVCAGLLISCSTSSTQESTPIEGGDNNPPPVTSVEWSIPISEVLDGGPGKDGIPALINPDISDVQDINYLQGNDLVIGFKRGNDALISSRSLLKWTAVAGAIVEAHRRPARSNAFTMTCRLPPKTSRMLLGQFQCYHESTYLHYIMTPA